MLAPRKPSGDLSVEGKNAMIKYIYDSRGHAIAYVLGNFIHSMRGAAIGQLRSTHVHRLSGEYVGELYQDMIVDMHLGNLGNVGHCGNPGNAGNPGNPGNRGIVNYGFPDISSKLF